ncbi:unnamed protein product [Spirodela intermedia]|uniref:NADP-dependent oxidoreductase domain-containing protein n=1 Tax=Spirodela intermedia TaxID=51605 RepID=A0A7I8IXZ0_SPIIN|nr:unnamed protein product [Spirodela intermedia]CAA6662727.1 unnamed protein product [Spirodela intermedia]
MRGKDGPSSSSFVLNTGARIPAIGLGTWLYGGDLCIAAVQTALRVGYRHIDCAHLYGNEIEVGKALAEAFQGGGLRREDLFLTSKLIWASNSHKRVENSVKVSLKTLGVSYLDLYLVHWPDTSSFEDATDRPWNAGTEYRQLSQALKPTWMAMEDLVAKGLVRAIGVSNFSVQQIKELLQFAKIVPAVNQVELHPFWRQDDIVRFCQDKGIHVSAHTPLGVPIGSGGGGTLQRDGRAEDEPGTPRISLGRSRSVHGPMLKLSVISEIAEARKKTPEQCRGDERAALQRDTDRIRKNFDIFNWTLSEEELTRMNRIEPQVCLFGSSSAGVSESLGVSASGHLQAVHETDDDDDSDLDS